MNFDINFEEQTVTVNGIKWSLLFLSEVPNVGSLSMIIEAPNKRGVFTMKTWGPGVVIDVCTTGAALKVPWPPVVEVPRASLHCQGATCGTTCGLNSTVEPSVQVRWNGLVYCDDCWLRERPRPPPTP